MAVIFSGLGFKCESTRMVLENSKCFPPIIRLIRDKTHDKKQKKKKKRGPQSCGICDTDLTAGLTMIGLEFGTELTWG